MVTHAGDSPFGVFLEPRNGEPDPRLVRADVRVSDLAGLVCDEEALQTMVLRGNPVVYTVATMPLPDDAEHLGLAMTTMQPGTIGDECFMTRGHIHRRRAAELYIWLAGYGGVVLFDGTTVRWIEMTKGVTTYIPPGWAHRSVNLGNEPYCFLAVYHPGAGHDYRAVAKAGMGAVVRSAATGYQVLDAHGQLLASGTVKPGR